MRGKGSKTHTAGPGLFIDSSRQLEFLEKSVEQRVREEQRVECLGLTFKSDEARRAYFLEKLCEKLKDPEFRKIEDFPIGDKTYPLSDPTSHPASCCSDRDRLAGEFS